MANLLESNATTATTTPAYYSEYLQNLAGSGINAAKNAQFVGAQPLQEQAFEQVGEKAGAYQPTLTAAGNTLAQAASTPSPLTSATPYFQTAGASPAELARQYMDPYTESVVSNIGDMGARNIRQNLAPQATSAAVGSGQFGSKRGAEVLGQTISNAERDVLNQQASALNTGYQNALTAAGQQNQLQANLGKAAGDLTTAGQQAMTQTGTAQGNLAATNQNLSLADINALATLGGQQQTIKQNQQNFPLTTLSTLSGLMAGQTIPTTQTQTASTSPLSLLASGTTGLAGLFTPKTDNAGNIIKDASGNPISAWSSLTGGLSGAAGAAASGVSGLSNTLSDWYKQFTAPAPVEGSQQEQATSGHWEQDEDGNWRFVQG